MHELITHTHKHIHPHVCGCIQLLNVQYEWRRYRTFDVASLEYSCLKSIKCICGIWRRLMACRGTNTHTHSRTHVLECIFQINIFSCVLCIRLLSFYFHCNFLKFFWRTPQSCSRTVCIFLSCLRDNMPHTCFDG